MGDKYMKCVWEHNGKDTLLYSADCIGAYTRGETLELAMHKMQKEIEAYSLWAGKVISFDDKIEIIQEKTSNLQIADADSDVIFASERLPLSKEEYDELKKLVLKSARDVQTLFDSVPDKERSCSTPRKTFYGNVPRSAYEMYEHMKSVNAYYFGEIGVEVDNDGTIFDCRQKGFEYLEQADKHLNNAVIEGSYGEMWSLRKMLRRFLWHDRIHAKAMYKMAVNIFGAEHIENPFQFSI